MVREGNVHLDTPHAPESRSEERMLDSPLIEVEEMPSLEVAAPSRSLQSCLEAFGIGRGQVEQTTGCEVTAQRREHCDRVWEMLYYL